jgi:hypothetical protein
MDYYIGSSNKKEVGMRRIGKLLVLVLVGWMLTGIVWATDNVYDDTVFYGDVSVGSRAAPTFTTNTVGTGGYFTNCTIMYKISALKDSQYVPLSTAITRVIADGDRSITISWPVYANCDQIALLRSRDAGTNYSYRLFSSSVTRFVDLGRTNNVGWTTNDFTTDYSARVPVSVPWTPSADAATKTELLNVSNVVYIASTNNARVQDDAKYIVTTNAARVMDDAKYIASTNNAREQDDVIYIASTNAARVMDDVIYIASTNNAREQDDAKYIVTTNAARVMDDVIYNSMRAGVCTNNETIRFNPQMRTIPTVVGIWVGQPGTNVLGAPAGLYLKSVGVASFTIDSDTPQTNQIYWFATDR